MAKVLNNIASSMFTNEFFAFLLLRKVFVSPTFKDFATDLLCSTDFSITAKCL